MKIKGNNNMINVRKIKLTIFFIGTHLKSLLMETYHHIQTKKL